MMLAIIANNGAPPAIPWSRAAIDRYFDDNRGCQGVLLRALVSGRDGRIFERDIDLGRAIGTAIVPGAQQVMHSSENRG
jgi:hypothetical protein